MVKMIVMDMDGTLLNSHNQITKKTKEILLEVQKKGIQLVLASGRSYMKLLPYAKELQMDIYGGYLVEVNGTAVYDVKNNQREVLAQMQVEQIHEIYAYFMQYHVEIIGQFDDGMYDYIPKDMMEEKRAYRKQHQLPQDYPWSAGAFHFIFDNRNGYPNLVYVHDYKEITHSINKVSVTYHPKQMEEITYYAKRDLSDRYWVGLTSPRWLEIMIPNVTKATGLERVAQKSGISLQDMMAFGDGENDIEMLKEVGLGIAMENAFAHVKEIADDVTSSNEEDGIAVAIKKYIDL